jgi:hemolysin III
MLTKFRDPVSGLTHLGAAVAAGFGLVLLLVLGRGDPAKELSLLVYGLSLVLLFAASAAYHLAQVEPVALLRLRKFDHSAIYLLIAGSYTPICLHFFGDFWQWGLLGIIWMMAVSGVIVKLFVIHAPRWITAGIYLVMGWLSVLALPQMLANMPAGALAWLVAGGLFYTLGAVVYVLKKPDFYPGHFGFHEIWHIFVILGAFSHFIVVAVFVAP